MELDRKDDDSNLDEERRSEHMKLLSDLKLLDQKETSILM